MTDQPLTLVNELAKLAESVYSLAVKHGEDRVLLHIRGLRIEISQNNSKTAEEHNIMPVWNTEW